MSRKINCTNSPRKRENDKLDNFRSAPNEDENTDHNEYVEMNALKQHISFEIKKGMEEVMQLLKEELLPVIETLKKKKRSIDYPTSVVIFLNEFYSKLINKL